MLFKVPNECRTCLIDRSWHCVLGAGVGRLWSGTELLLNLCEFEAGDVVDVGTVHRAHTDELVQYEVQSLHEAHPKEFV